MVPLAAAVAERLLADRVGLSDGMAAALTPSGHPQKAHSSAADCTSCGQPRTIPGAQVSGHVEQCLQRQPIAVVQEFSDRAAVTCRHRCSPSTPGQLPCPKIIKTV